MAERLELIKTVDKIHLCSSILSSQIKMKQNFKLFAALAASAAMMFSCQQAEDPTMDKAQEPIVKTRAYGDKTPKVTIYVCLLYTSPSPRDA